MHVCRAAYLCNDGDALVQTVTRRASVELVQQVLYEAQRCQKLSLSLTFSMKRQEITRPFQNIKEIHLQSSLTDAKNTDKVPPNFARRQATIHKVHQRVSASSQLQSITDRQGENFSLTLPELGSSLQTTFVAPSDVQQAFETRG